MSVKAWLFTKFNYNEDHLIDLNIQNIIDSKFLIWQEEVCPLTNARHIQGFIRFKENHRVKWLKSAIGLGNDIHLLIANGDDAANIKYCSDLEKRMPYGKYYQEGTPSLQGERTDIDSLHEALLTNQSLLEISDNHFTTFLRYHKGIYLYRSLRFQPRVDKPTVLVFWGDSGTGKTRKATSISDDFYILSPGNSRNCWFDGYSQNKVLIIDDYYGWMRYGYLLQLLDRYPFRVELKGGSMEFASQLIIITSNSHPEDWYRYQDNMTYAPLERRISSIYKFPLALDVVFDF